MEITKIVKKVSKKVGTTQSETEENIKTFLELIKANTKKEGIARISGFGTFRTSENKARKGINPRTGEPVNVPAKTRVLFKPSKDFLN